MSFIFNPLSQLIVRLLSFLEQTFLPLTRPSRHSIVLYTAADLTRSRAELIAENALLRQQLIILHHYVKKSRFTAYDQLGLMLLASRVRNWKQALLILQPDTLLRWHRQGFRLFWKFKSQSRGGRPKLSVETIALIRQMAKQNRLWGAERIRGELLKLGLRVAKRTIQKYIRQMRPQRAPSQDWSTLLKNHAKEVSMCDFLPVIDLFFRPI